MYLDRRLLDLANERRLALWSSVGLGVAAGVATAIQALALARTVARVFLEGAGLEAVTGDLLLLTAAVAGRALCIWGSEEAAARVSIAVRQRLRARLLAHLFDIGPLAVRGARSGAVSATVNEGVAALDAYLRHYLPQLALAVLVPAGIAAFVLSRDLLSGLVLLVTAPLIPLFMYLIGSLARRRSDQQWRSLSRLSGHFLDVLQGLPTLRLLGQSRAQLEEIRAVTDRHRLATMGVLRVAFLSALALELLATLSTAVVAVEVGLRTLYGHLPFESAFFVLLLAPEFYLPLRLLGARFHAGVSGVSAAREIFELLDRSGPSRAVATAKIAGPIAGGSTSAKRPTLRLEQVSFSYPGGEGDDGQRGADRRALDAVDLELHPGETLAVVGESGAGKSTLVQLVLRFADPQAGRVLVDGVDLRTLDVAEWRSRLAWVPERPHLFAGTVGENIRLARPDASDHDVEEAARAAQAHAFISALPQGYGTPVGEGGVLLSGGEAQRVALARAFLRDAPILLLDEVTAHLDPDLEDRLVRATARLLENRSALVVAHRRSTIGAADRVVVLDNGRVVEAGAPAELAARRGALHRLLDVTEGRGA